MPRIALALVVSLLSSPVPGAAPATSPAADAPPPIAVFVGEQLDFAELPDPCEDPDNRVELHGGASGDTAACVVMDTSYWARYRIVEPVLGTGDRREIEFLVSDHYGVPDFAKTRTALLFVTLEAEGAALLKYQGYSVHPTADGDWAFCGDPYPPGTPADVRRIVPLEFAPGLSFADLSTLGPYATAQFDADTYERDGARLRCRRGVRLLDLFEHVVRDKLGASGFDLGLPPAESASDAAPGVTTPADARR